MERDRVVQAKIKLLPKPIFDSHFSPNSYGFRPGRNQHQAVQQINNSVNGLAVMVFYEFIPTAP
jgi:RNA-directed DNA polymerase